MGALERVWSAKDFGHPRVLSHEWSRIFPLLREAASQTIGRILEVGVGNGRMTSLLRADDVTAQLYGIDVTDQVRDAPCIRAVADARSLPFRDGAFNLVYSLGVIEHFPETAKAIAEQARVVASDGLVLISAPHLGVQTGLRWLWYLVRGDWRASSFEVVSGRNLSLRYLREAVSQSELVDLESGATGPVVYLSLPAVLKQFINQVFPQARFGSYVYVLARKP